VLDREPAVVRAELAVAPELGGQHRGLAYGPQYWGGVMRSRNVGTDFSGFATTVSAQWQVPEVLTVDPAGRQQLNIAFWIGLNDGSEQVLQAGIAAVVSPGWFGTDVNYFAWTEWWTRQYADPAVRVTNFPVTAGDTVAMTVCAPQPDYGFVTMTNVTRNQGTSVGIQARPGVTSVGGSVEWVLESSAPSPLLPAFRPITFTDCYGGSSTESFHLLPDPTVVAITSTRRKTLTATQILSSTSAQVSWLDFD
jgi:hypothetical protein